MTEKLFNNQIFWEYKMFLELLNEKKQFIDKCFAGRKPGNIWVS